MKQNSPKIPDKTRKQAGRKGEDLSGKLFA